MELSSEVCSVLINFGVGKRSPHDDFFKDNHLLLTEMSERIGVFEIDSSNTEKLAAFQCQVPGCKSQFERLVEFESHYNTAHRYTCCECKKTLPSAHFLDLHVAETHDCFFAVMAERGPAYSCYIEICKTKFFNAKERMNHCISEHKFPPNFRFDIARTGKKSQKRRKKKNSQNSSAQSSDMAIDEDGHPPEAGYKPPKGFNFCHSKQKTFYSSNKKTLKPSTLDSDSVMSDLKANLPEC